MKALLIVLVTLQLASVAQSPKIQGAGWTSDGRYLVTIGANRQLSVLDGRDGKPIKRKQADGDTMTYVSFSPDSGSEEPNNLVLLGVSGDYAVTGSVDQTLQWWKVPELDLEKSTTTQYALQGLSLAAEGKVAAYSESSTRYLDSSVGLVRWTDSGLAETPLPDLPPPDSSSSFGVPQLSPDGKWAVGGVADEFRLWNLEKPDAPSITLVGISPESLAMGSQHYYTMVGEETIRRSYDTPVVEDQSYACPGGGRLAVDESERHLVGLFDDGVWIWNLDQDNTLRQWSVKAENLTLCPDGKTIGLWKKGWFEIWDLDSQTFLFKLPRL